MGRYTPSMISLSLFLQQAASPDQCFLTGLCGLVAPHRPVAPGVMFVAVGLVSVGIWGLRRRSRPTED